MLVCVYSAVNGIKTTKLLLTNTTGIDRGEGFNHAILDNWGLTAAVQRIYDTLHAEDAAAATEVRDAAIAEFQADVRRRGSNAVHMCREACLEVHQWETLSEKSTVRQKSIL